MKRRDFLTNCGLGLTAAAISPVLSIADDKKWWEIFKKDGNSEQRPNIFIYVADDQYKDSVGCYGAKPSYTPNIDKLAQEGLKFTQCFTPSAICTPNRGVLLTGMYPLKNGAHANHSGFFDGIKSLPNYMKENGYRACISGKDGIQKPSDLYEWEFRIAKSKEMVPGADEPKHERHRKTNLKEVEAFVSARDDRPFCHFHAASLPHSPYLNKSLDGLEGYDASNHYGDYELGEMLKILDRHGKRDNTIVIYVNDNEAGLPRTKFMLYDSSTNVPMIIRWPGYVKAGTSSSAMVSFIDIMPTLLSIVGTEPPSNMDGQSILEVMNGTKEELHDELFFSLTGVIVSTSGANDIPYPIRAIRTKQYRYIRYLNFGIEHPKRKGQMSPYEELFNHQTDPDELKNLASDPAYESIRLELSQKVDAWMAAMGDKGIESELATLKKYAKDKKK